VSKADEVRLKGAFVDNGVTSPDMTVHPNGSTYSLESKLNSGKEREPSAERKDQDGARHAEARVSEPDGWYS